MSKKRIGLLLVTGALVSGLALLEMFSAGNLPFGLLPVNVPVFLAITAPFQGRELVCVLGLWLFFLVANVHVLFSREDISPRWMLNWSRGTLYLFGLLSATYYLMRLGDALTYNGHVYLTLCATQTSIWFAICYIRLHGKRSPGTVNHLIIAGGLVFFGAYTFFFPWLGELI